MATQVQTAASGVTQRSRTNRKTQEALTGYLFISPWIITALIFTFPPGYSLPVIETHVMEHGLYFLEGQGLYYLGDTWREVKAGDFIWMGPYVPQGFFATSSGPSRYIYYKNINRDVVL